LGKFEDLMKKLIKVPPKEIEKPSMKNGYKFPLWTCPKCGKEIAENWAVRHIKADCKVPKRTP
jgi:hypothetical protein